jgi:acetamidase/formamidase
MPGPVAIRGAEPGDVIECRMLKLRPSAWGWNSAPHGVGALPNDFATPDLHYVRFDDARTSAEFTNGVRILLRPIQGVISVQPASDKPVSAILTGAWGGNIVLSELVAGTSLFLPVQVPGGKMWTGDSHAAQGDGVVNQTAIETAMDDLQIQYVLHKGRALWGPIAETPTHWITLGYSNDSLDDAITAALRNAIAWISAATQLSGQDVYAKTFISETAEFPEVLAPVVEIRQTPPSVSVPSTSIRNSLISERGPTHLAKRVKRGRCRT